MRGSKNDQFVHQTNKRIRNKAAIKRIEIHTNPSSNKQDLRKDIKEYPRKLRLAEYFNNTESDEENENTQLYLVKNK